MTDRDLKTLLRELDHALDAHPVLDDSTRALITEVRADLDRAIAVAPDAAAAALPPEAHDSLRERLGAAVTEFERNHPALVEATQRVLDQLSILGV